MDARYEVLDEAARLAREFLADLPERHVDAQADLDELRARLDRRLDGLGEDPRRVIRHLAQDADPGLVASAGPRYFGFAIGRALPVAVAAVWLVSAWIRNGMTPSAFSLTARPRS